MLSRSLALGLSALCLMSATTASAQLRIVSYNTANGSFGGNNINPRTGMDNVLEAIGDESVNGIAKPIDVLLLQEQDEPTTSTQAFVDLLNGIYGAGTYARTTTVTGPASSSLRQTAVYNTQTVSLINEIAFGTTGSSAAARQTGRYVFRPVGYNTDADFVVYNNHYKAGDSSSDQTRRNFEAGQVRTNADALGDGFHIIYAGDFNIDSSVEGMYQTLLAAGNGQAFDPIATPGNWSNASFFAAVHTQSPHDGTAGLVGGGMDDRFDFQLVSGEFLDNEGLSYIPGSYRAFGNNGNTFNRPVNDFTNTYPLSASILDDLAHVSDHLPVVADYQLPAILDVFTSTIPTTLNVGESFDLELTIRNAADVVAANGADELDYDFLSLGNLSGSGSGTDDALGGGAVEMISFDTSTPGSKAGLIRVTSNSQAIPNGLIEIPVLYEVLASAIEGDYDGSGQVGQTDLNTVLLNWGDSTFPGDAAALPGGGPFDGTISQNELNGVLLNWGNTAESSAAVPEPAFASIALGVALLRRRRSTSRYAS